MKQRITFALLMGSITTGIISITLVALNYGVRPRFFTVWFRSWCVSYFQAVLVILFVGPWVQVFVNFLLKETELNAKERQHHTNSPLNYIKNNLQENCFALNTGSFSIISCLTLKKNIIKIVSTKMASPYRSQRPGYLH